MKKRSLFAAVAMLLVSAVVLTSATYAWFASGSKADITTIGAEIAEKDGTLQIATITTEGSANWGVTLNYTDWLTSGGATISGSHGANTTVSNAQAFTTLSPISVDFSVNNSGSPVVAMKKGHLSEITDPTSSNYKKFNFITDGNVTTSDQYVDLKFYVKANVPCTITLDPVDFSSDINFIYGAITANPVAGYTSTADQQNLATLKSAATVYQVLGNTGASYTPVISGTSNITKLDADSNGIIDSTEDGETNTILKLESSAGAGDNIIEPTSQSVQFRYTEDMAASEYAVECHLYLWAEGQDATCHGAVSPSDASYAVRISRS